MNQCPSCGGWCGYTKAKGCNYADLPIQQDLQTMISRNGELEQQMQAATQIEREACAKLCDALDNDENGTDYRDGVVWCAERIRGRNRDRSAP